MQLPPRCCGPVASFLPLLPPSPPRPHLQHARHVLGVAGRDAAGVRAGLGRAQHHHGRARVQPREAVRHGVAQEERHVLREGRGR